MDNRKRTRFKDMDGKRIRLGDVLLYSDTESEYVDVGVGGQGVKVAEQEVNSIAFIEYRDGQFGIIANAEYGDVLQHKKWYSLRKLIGEEVRWVKIIGDIYENPELVEL